MVNRCVQWVLSHHAALTREDGEGVEDYTSRRVSLAHRPLTSFLPPSLPPSLPQVNSLLCHVLEVSAEGAKEAVEMLHCHTAGRDVAREGRRERGKGRQEDGKKEGRRRRTRQGMREGKRRQSSPSGPDSSFNACMAGTAAAKKGVEEKEVAGEEGLLIYLHMGVDAEAKELKLVREGRREGRREGGREGGRKGEAGGSHALFSPKIISYHSIHCSSSLFNPSAPLLFVCLPPQECRAFNEADFRCPDERQVWM